MKKKSLLFLSVCVMLLLCAALTACSLVTTNEERKASREMATVTVDLVKEYGNGVKVLGNDWNYVVSLPITRRELTTTVNYAINYYSQLYAQYGLTYDYDLDSLLDSGFTQLKKQKYNAIMAMGKLLAESKTTSPSRFDALYCRTEEYQAIYGKNLMPEGVLTIAERYAIIGEVNETFQTRLEGYLDETEDDDRNKEISEANDVISGYYTDGYFMAGVEIAWKDGEEFKDELYTDVVIDDGNSETEDIDYRKIYAKVRLTKTGEEDKYVYVPLGSTALSTEEDEGADNAKYTTAKTATISFSGRVYAAKTDDNDTGYEVESFTSKPAEYSLVAPRYQPAAAEEEDEDAKLNAVRYVTIEGWADEANRTEEMNALIAEIFDPNPDTYSGDYDLTEIKDAYRQLRTYFKSANIGFVEEDPGKDDMSAYVNYTYYNGLKYYYEAEFNSHVLEVLEYELSEKVTEVEGTEILPEYELLVKKDKANYEYLTQAEQVTKFFSTVGSTDTDGLSNVYYVPIDALMAESYEVDPTDKRYEELFTFDNEGNLTGYNAEYVHQTEEGAYEMHYAYANEDGTYTINMFYIAHILMNFDNVDGLAEAFARESKDYADKMVFIQKFVPQIMTDPQLLSYIDEYDADKEYTLADVYKTDENGAPAFETYAEAQEGVEQALTEALATGEYEDFLRAFYDLVEQYNDDRSFKITANSGYMISAGDMANPWVKDFTATSLKIYFGLLNKGELPTGYDDDDATTLADRMMVSYTDYGSHNIIVSFAPLYHVAIDEYGGIGLETKLTTSGTTRFDEIGESLLKTKKDKQYTDWQAAFTEEVIEKATTVNEKNYKNFKKEIK